MENTMSRQATIDSRITKYHIHRLNEIEQAMNKAEGRELQILEKSRDYHLMRLQAKWYGNKYNCSIRLN